MSFEVAIGYVTALIASLFAIAGFFWGKSSVSGWTFSLGMVLVGLRSAGESSAVYFAGRSGEDIGGMLSIFASLFIPGVWTVFSLCYSRGTFREYLSKWRYLIAMVFVVPLVTFGVYYPEFAAISFSARVYVNSGKSIGFAVWALSLTSLVTSIVVLSNLEKTLRAAVGLVRWRIKFVILGVGVMSGAEIYTSSQALLQSGKGGALIVVNACATLIACAFFVIALMRRGFASVEVYPSRAVIQTSLTTLFTGGFLLLIGVSAELLKHVDAVRVFHSHILMAVLGGAVLSVLLFSDRLRDRSRHFVARHFRRPVHDYRHVWMELTRRVGMVFDQRDLCRVSADLISESLEVLSVSVWLVDEGRGVLNFVAGTNSVSKDRCSLRFHASPDLRDRNGDRVTLRPFFLDQIHTAWEKELSAVAPSQFPGALNRICVPLVANSSWIGVIILADKVNGREYQAEELELLECIGEQVASNLVKIRLTDELMQRKEFEAFQTMSAFFVHDLKNAASSIGLTLQNLPVHFDDPDFRAEAVRGIGKAVDRIQQLIRRLSSLRDQLELKPKDVDLNELVSEAVQQLPTASTLRISRDLKPVPKVRVDREQFQSVIRNLLLNAYDAVDGRGEIKVKTSTRDGYAVLSIADDGCGMPAEFVKDYLFRPFRSTKKNGLGIGMFQSGEIVRAHRGKIEVDTELGKGTEFLVTVPLSVSS